MKRSVLSLLFLAAALPGLAQNGEFSLSFGTSTMRNNSLSSIVGEYISADSGFNFALRGTFNDSRHFGHEIGYAYNRGTLTISGSANNMSIHQGFYDFLLYGMKEGAKVRPFVCGGAGFSTFVPPGASVTQGSGITKFGFNYGGGIKAKISDSFLIRVDVRDYITGKPDFGTSPSGLLQQLVGSAGLAFTF